MILNFLDGQTNSYPKELRVNFLKLQISTLVAYAKAFGLEVSDDMSHVDLASMVAQHFLEATVEENKIVLDFYEKTEAIRLERKLIAESVSSPAQKRQSKKPKKFELSDVTCHYNTRSRASDIDENDIINTSVPIKAEPDEEKYCICDGKGTGDMVQCENPDCHHKWYHYMCVGITDPDSLPAVWYCSECSQ